MQKFFITKSHFLSTLNIFFVLMFSNAIAAEQKTDNWLDKPISISFQNEPLNAILKTISEQTGVSIAFDQELANEKVTGNYQNVKTSDAIVRLFRGENISIQVNTEEKVIIVKTFGAKNFIWAHSDKKRDNSSTMSLAELNTFHKQQYKEYKERIANENEIIEGGGNMTRGELRLMHEKQYKTYKARIANDDEIIEGDKKASKGMTRGELRSMHEEQYKAYEARIANDDEIIEGDKKASKGMTRGGLRAMHEQQYTTYKKRLSNDKEVLKGGMTRGELRAMHEQQYKDYQKRIQNNSYVSK